MLKDLTSKNFKKEVLDEKDPVLVDFYADWCGPCKVMAPVVKEVAEEVKKDVKVVKINIEKSEELAGEYGVMSVPTFLVFKDGKIIDQTSGAMPKDKLVKFVKRAIR